jgi:hypothetical protein
MPGLVGYGREHNRLRSKDTSSLLHRLFEGYRQEGLAMPYTMEDFHRDYVKEHLEDLPPELRREDLTPGQVTRILRAQDLLNTVSPEEGLEILSVLPPEESRALLAHAPEPVRRHFLATYLLKSLPPEEILKRLPREAIEDFLKHQQNGSSSAPQSGDQPS